MTNFQIFDDSSSEFIVQIAEMLSHKELSQLSTCDTRLRSILRPRLLEEAKNVIMEGRLDTCPRNIVMRIAEYLPKFRLPLLNKYFQSMFLPMFDVCSNTDVTLKITEMLNPKEVARLASCNSYFRSILPKRPLRINIVCTNEEFCMDNRLFVTEYNSGRMLEHNEYLIQGNRYIFWLFDEDRGHRVHMACGTPIGERGGTDLALMTRRRSELDPASHKCWIVESEDGDLNMEEGMPIPFGSNVKIVQYDDRKSIDAKDRLQLSVIQLEEWQDEGKVLWYASKSSATTTHEFRIMRSEDLTLVYRRQLIMTPIEIRASPVFHFDGGSMGIYSARSLEGGTLFFEGRSKAVVTFELWTEEGFLHLKAVDIPQYRNEEDSIDFALSVPMIREGEERFTYRNVYNEHPVLETFVNIRLEHWFAVKLYLAAAADVILWRTSQYERLESFSNHELLVDKGECIGKKFVFKDTNSNETPYMKPEHANIPPDPSRQFFCAIVDKKMS